MGDFHVNPIVALGLGFGDLHRPETVLLTLALLTRRRQRLAGSSTPSKAKKKHGKRRHGKKSEESHTDKFAPPLEPHVTRLWS